MTRRNAFFKFFRSMTLVPLLFHVLPTIAQGDPTITNTPVYIVPPGLAPPSSSSSSFDFWWPFPPAPTPVPSSISQSSDGNTASTPAPSTSSASLVEASFAFYPTVNISVESLQPLNAGSSSVPTSQTTAAPPSSTSDSIIRITATSSPEAQEHHDTRKFKIVYLTPLFALIGLVSGATFGGMLYGWYARRKFQQADMNDMNRDDVFNEADVLAYPYPRSRTTLLELGEGYGHLADKEFENGSESDMSPSHGFPSSKRSPYEAPSAALQGASSSSEYGPSPSNNLNKGPSSTNIARPWYDRLPGLAAQVSGSTTTRSSRSAKKIGTPFAVDHMSPASDGTDEFVARDIRSHSSIRRAIADRLRVGSRRVGGRKEGLYGDQAEQGLLAAHDILDDDDVTAVRRASGNQIRELEGGALQRRAQRGPTATMESRYRKVIHEFKDSETIPFRLTPDENARASIDGFEGGPDDESEQDDDSYKEITMAQGRVTSATSSLLPNPRRNSSSSKLRPKSRLMSPTTTPGPPLDAGPGPGPNSVPKRKIRPRSSITSPADPTNDQETPPTLRLLNPPRRVISPPAHPDLFFADPVLANYINDDNDRPAPRIRAKKPITTISDRKQDHKRLQRLKPPAGDVPDANSPSATSDGTKSASGGEYSSASTASAFHGRPMKPARAREMLGAVDAIMQSGYSTREDIKSAVSEENNQRRMQRLRDAGLGERPR